MPVQMPDATSSYTAAEPAGTDNHISDTSQAEDTSGSGSMMDAASGDGSDKKVAMEDFLTSMVAQLKNQDFMNPVDDTQYVTQLTQISTVQQMEGMSYNAKSIYVASLVGKYVAAVKFTVSGEFKKTEEIADKIPLLGEKFVTYVNGEPYNTDEIMEIKTEPANNPDDSRNKKPGEDKSPEEGNSKA